MGLDAPVSVCENAPLDLLCTGYCAGVSNVCTGGFAQFPSEAACQATCATWACGTPGETTGDTFFCRATHLAMVVAGLVSTLPECVNAGPTSPACQ